MGKVILALILFAAPSYAALVPAASCERAAVEAAISTSVNGDIVTIPMGTCRWTGTAPTALGKAITLAGAGCNYDSLGRPIDGTCLTVIQDGMTSGAILNITLVAGLNTRITGIHWDGEFDGTPGAYASPERPGQSFFELFNLAGQTGGGAMDARRIRIDHCIFETLNSLAIGAARAWGVIDHNRITSIATRIPIYVYGTGTSIIPWSDARWSEANTWGTENNLFIENNYISMNTQYAVVDSYGGARMVFRYNEVINGHFTMHGTESAARARGARAAEVYGNTFSGTGTAQLSFIRSGTALVYNNTATGYTTAPAAQLVNERCLYSFPPWMQCDGRSYWDANDAGNPIATRTSTSGGGSGTLTVTDSTASFPSYIGYAIKKTTAAPAAWDRTVDYSVGDFVTISDGRQYRCLTASNTGEFPSLSAKWTTKTLAALIVSNTSTAITFTSDGGFSGDNLFFAVGGGDTFEINKITEVLDGIGRGQGSLLEQKTVASVASSTTTATLTVTGNGYSNSNVAAILDVNLSVASGNSYVNDYNGNFVISNVAANAFDYTFNGGMGAATDAGNVTKRPAGWNDQVTEPCYEWNNTLTGASITFSIPPEYTLSTRENEHYFAETVAPGYTPYTYPHPLITAMDAPGGRLNLRIRK